MNKSKCTKCGSIAESSGGALAPLIGNDISIKIHEAFNNEGGDLGNGLTLVKTSKVKGLLNLAESVNRLRIQFMELDN